MYKVILINYDYKDELYRSRRESFEEDLETGRDATRPWEAPEPPILEKYEYDFDTKEEAEAYANQDIVQDCFNSIAIEYVSCFGDARCFTECKEENCNSCPGFSN